jgi:hypothetical protein
MQFLVKKSTSLYRSLGSVLKFSYHENVVNRFENPTNVGSLDSKKKNVGTGIVPYLLPNLPQDLSDTLPVVIS